ncbi:hypothetical protein D2M30_1156 [Bacillus amyloliquefaciens]|nr:hypothetical protein D2M30_1156 [Bacillus amyloliquefaciens]
MRRVFFCEKHCQTSEKHCKIKSAFEKALAQNKISNQLTL